jgi:glutamine---fructose-6-phosphate transaminase (isomerizing)
MCGIFGVVANRNIVPLLIESLNCLQYRGYDSAGFAIIDPEQHLICRRTLGKIAQLEKNLKSNPVSGCSGIAHTRWATHGKPSQENAHPHVSNETVALVHNGIIENHQDWHQELLQAGYQFSSETDTEVVAHLIHQQLKQTASLEQAVYQTIQKLTGSFALAFLIRNYPDCLIAVRQDSPLVIGLGSGENYLASDQLALVPFTQDFIYLEDGDIAFVYRDKIIIKDRYQREVKRKIYHSTVQANVIDKGQHQHYMQKEIFEQPKSVRNALENRLAKDHIAHPICAMPEAIYQSIQRIRIIGCGTSYHAGLVGRYWLETLAKLPCTVEIASEVQHRNLLIEPNTLLVSLSQSGETADTLNALRAAKNHGYLGTLAICNVMESALVRESDYSILLHAGPEIGVASTKAFITQLVVLILLSLDLASRDPKQHQAIARWVKALNHLPEFIERVLLLDHFIAQLAHELIDKTNALFIARGIYFPIALEGALKLQEISYIHAQAYPAGELKHGALALVEKNLPVIVLAPPDPSRVKLKNNIEEICARSGQLILVTDNQFSLKSYKDIHRIVMPEADELLNPFLYTIPLQLLAYHVAVLKGNDVDQPRNLAKSVTVE